MFIAKNTWLLVPKLEPDYDVEFETLSTHD